MLKGILNLTGVEKLTSSAKQKIKGGENCTRCYSSPTGYDHNNPDCWGCTPPDRL